MSDGLVAALRAVARQHFGKASPDAPPAPDAPPVVKHHAGEAATREALRAVLGRDADLAHLPAVAGAVPGTTVHVRPDAHGVHLRVEHPDNHYEAWGSVRRDPAGKPELHIGEEVADPNGPVRNGYRRFAARVEALRAWGVPKVSLQALTGGGYNGLQTWPKFGFDGPLGHLAYRMPKELKAAAAGGPATFHRLRAFPGYDEWLKGAVGDARMVFHTAPDSPHSKILEEYVRGREGRGGTDRPAEQGVGVGGGRAAALQERGEAAGRAGGGGGDDLREVRGGEDRPHRRQRAGRHGLRRLSRADAPRAGDHVHTPAFKAWFGDWEAAPHAASKAVGSDGRPLVLFHGTRSPKDFDTFSTDGPPGREDEMDDEFDAGSGQDPSAHLGAHFAEEPRVADKFATGGGADWLRSRYVGGQARGRVFPVHLNVRNPKVYESEDDLQADLYRQPIGHPVIEELAEESDDPDGFYERYDADPDFREEVNRDAMHRVSGYDDDYDQRDIAGDLASGLRRHLRSLGHDGVKYPNAVEGGTSWAVFDPHQIKSAIANRGGFDPSEGRINMSRSPAAEAVVRLARLTNAAAGRDEVLARYGLASSLRAAAGKVKSSLDDDTANDVVNAVGDRIDRTAVGRGLRAVEHAVEHPVEAAKAVGGAVAGAARSASSVVASAVANAARRAASVPERVMANAVDAAALVRGQPMPQAARPGSPRSLIARLASGPGGKASPAPTGVWRVEAMDPNGTEHVHTVVAGDEKAAMDHVKGVMGHFVTRVTPAPVGARATAAARPAEPAAPAATAPTKGKGWEVVGDGSKPPENAPHPLAAAVRGKLDKGRSRMLAGQQTYRGKAGDAIARALDRARDVGGFKFVPVRNGKGDRLLLVSHAGPDGAARTATFGYAEAAHLAGHPKTELAQHVAALRKAANASAVKAGHRVATRARYARPAGLAPHLPDLVTPEEMAARRTPPPAAAENLAATVDQRPVAARGTPVARPTAPKPDLDTTRWQSQEAAGGPPRGPDSEGPTAISDFASAFAAKAKGETKRLTPELTGRLARAGRTPYSVAHARDGRGNRFVVVAQHGRDGAVLRHAAFTHAELAPHVENPANEWLARHVRKVVGKLKKARGGLIRRYSAGEPGDVLPPPFPTVAHITDHISRVTAQANGRRRTRTVTAEDVLGMLTGHDHLVFHRPQVIAPRVANAYGYPAQGTYVHVARKRNGDTVLGVWEDSTNRSGRFGGVTARRPDRMQDQIDALEMPEVAPGQTPYLAVLKPEHVAALVGGVGDESALLRAMAHRPLDDTPKLVYADWLDDNGHSDLAARIRSHIETARTPPSPERYARPRTDFLDALRRVRSKNQQAVHQAVAQVAAKLGITGHKTLDALYDTPAASVPGVAQALGGPASDPAVARYAAAWHGLFSGSPAVAVFHVGKGGDLLHRFRVSGSGGDVRQRLDAAGILRRHLIPHRNGWDILVPDIGGKLAPSVRDFAQKAASPLETSRGSLEVIGGSDPTAARAKYRDVVTQFEGQGGGKVQMSRRGTPVRYSADHLRRVAAGEAGATEAFAAHLRDAGDPRAAVVDAHLAGTVTDADRDATKLVVGQDENGDRIVLGAVPRPGSRGLLHPVVGWMPRPRSGPMADPAVPFAGVVSHDDAARIIDRLPPGTRGEFREFFDRNLTKNAGRRKSPRQQLFGQLAAEGGDRTAAIIRIEKELRLTPRQAESAYNRFVAPKKRLSRLRGLLTRYARDPFAPEMLAAKGPATPGLPPGPAGAKSPAAVGKRELLAKKVAEQVRGSRFGQHLLQLKKEFGNDAYLGGLVDAALTGRGVYRHGTDAFALIGRRLNQYRDAGHPMAKRASQFAGGYNWGRAASRLEWDSYVHDFVKSKLGEAERNDPRLWSRVLHTYSLDRGTGAPGMERHYGQFWEALRGLAAAKLAGPNSSLGARVPAGEIDREVQRSLVRLATREGERAVAGGAKVPGQVLPPDHAAGGRQGVFDSLPTGRGPHGIAYRDRRVLADPKSNPNRFRRLAQKIARLKREGSPVRMSAFSDDLVGHAAYALDNPTDHTALKAFADRLVDSADGEAIPHELAEGYNRFVNGGETLQSLAPFLRDTTHVAVGSNPNEGVAPYVAIKPNPRKSPVGVGRYGNGYAITPEVRAIPQFQRAYGQTLWDRREFRPDREFINMTPGETRKLRKKATTREVVHALLEHGGIANLVHTILGAWHWHPDRRESVWDAENDRPRRGPVHFSRLAARIAALRPSAN